MAVGQVEAIFAFHLGAREKTIWVMELQPRQERIVGGIGLVAAFECADAASGLKVFKLRVQQAEGGKCVKVVADSMCQLQLRADVVTPGGVVREICKSCGVGGVGL